jgi:O-antigen ligase
MFSNAGIILPILAGIIIFLINKLKKLKISRKQISIILIFFSLFTVAFIVFLFFDIGNISNYFEAFFDKILFNEGDKSYSSSGQRLKQWQRAFLNFIQKPVLGNGPGFGVNEDPEGYLSVYLTILSDIGILGLLLFLSFLNVIIQRVMKLELIPRSFLLFGVIVSFLHLTIIADFYHAPFWILLFFIQLIYKERKVNLL